jgi:predicted acyl esterase
LQVAALTAPELKCIAIVCSTGDRYADDVAPPRRIAGRLRGPAVGLDDALHGSVIEDPSDIKAAVLTVGGWAHPYPHRASPGPAMDFADECLKWFDRFLRENADRHGLHTSQCRFIGR